MPEWTVHPAMSFPPYRREICRDGCYVGFVQQGYGHPYAWAVRGPNGKTLRRGTAGTVEEGVEAVRNFLELPPAWRGD